MTRYFSIRRSGAAFTLVEVLVALTIFAVVIYAVLSGVDLATRTASHARNQAEAATLAEAKLAEIVAGGDWQRAGQQGDFGGDFPAYRWALQSRDRDMDLTELMLVVTWKEQGQERSVSMATLAYNSGGL